MTTRGILRRSAASSALGLCTCVLLVIAACERTDESGAAPRAEPGAAPPAEPVSRATLPGDSVAGTAVRVRRVPAPPPEDIAPAEPDAIAAEPDVERFATPADLQELSAGLVVPVQGVNRSELRDTYDEARGGRRHEALDIMAARGTPVLSAADGRVLRLFDSRPGGLMVYATDRSERFILLYGHLDGYADGLGDGMPLRRGQVIGYVGTTGNAAVDAPHLHFGILRGNPRVSWSEGIPVNPYPLLVPAGGAR